MAAPIQFSGNPGTVPAVGPNGEIYVAYKKGAQIWLLTSLDGGDNWSAQAIATVIWLDSPLPGADFRTPTFPTIAVDRSNGNVYVAWQDNDGVGLGPDILFIRSTDGGMNWSAPIRVSDDANGSYQFFPWLSVRPNGMIDIVFLDRRDMPGSTFYHTYYAASNNEGLSFFGNVRISDQISNSANAQTPMGSTFIGDYIGMVSSTTDSRAMAHPLWTDTRGMANAEAFTAQTGVYVKFVHPDDQPFKIEPHSTDSRCPPAPTEPGAVVLGEWDFEANGGFELEGWTPVDLSGRGIFADVYDASGVLQSDPCLSNASGVAAFFDDPASTNYGCGGAPWQGAVPFGDVSGLYLANEIWSPVIECGGTGSSVRLEFATYRDLALRNLVFYTWSVRSFVGGVPTDWRSENWYYYGGEKPPSWAAHAHEIGGLIEPGATHIQIALGVYDLCGIWCSTVGGATCHSHAPLFDDVRVTQISTQGPQWNVRQLDLFQDNFARDGTLTGVVRADAALDIAPKGSPTILPGDSVCVWVSDRESGLATDWFTGSGAAVYAYVAVWPQSQPGKTGDDLEAPETRGTLERFPFVDNFNHDGVEWFCFRMDTALVDSTMEPAPNRFCFDLNDDVFTPGDTICFVFAARNGAGVTTYWNEFIGTTTDLGKVFSCPMEFTCLPAGGWVRGGDILYVDAFDGHGAEPYFETDFKTLGLGELVDRYDQRAPSSLVNNSLASRVKAVMQLAGCYRTIIWNSGNLPNGTLSDGSQSPLKADDYALLFTFLDTQGGDAGLYLSGDNLGEEWFASSGAGAGNLRAAYMDFDLTSGDHVDAGDAVSPSLEGAAVPFVHLGGPDELIAWGGCPGINAFDILLPQGSAAAGVVNPANNNAYALTQETPILGGGMVRVVLSGFSYHVIADETPGFPTARIEHLRDILVWFGHTIDEPTSIDGSAALTYYLDDNYPNPFNPSTTIQYGLEQRSRVLIQIFNVAGQLVRTLVDAEQSPHSGGLSTTWYGNDERGHPVASGVYFYRLSAGNFVKTKRMVLLK
jgi:hypothetical protein